MKQLLVALHTNTKEQTFEEAALIHEAGADGIILVNNGGRASYRELFTWANELKLSPRYSKFSIGINPLELPISSAINHMIIKGNSIDILWNDGSGLIEDLRSIRVRENISGAFADIKIHRKFRYFGSIALKGRYQPKDLAQFATVAAQEFDVVVTSGDRTGVPPDVEKLKIIREAIGPEKPFAQASGTDAENIHRFLPYVDIFIVGTSLQISKDDMFRYDKRKIKDLADIIHS